MIDKEGGVPGLAIDLGVPIVVLERFVIGIAEFDERLRSLLNVEGADGDMVDDRK